jgi:ABC-type nitrate/sulfonate/bicarbonate transport system ATPase subunit
VPPAGGAEGRPLRVEVRAKRFPAVGDAPAKLAVADLRLEAAPGSFVALVGPSGCGKTTTLNVVAGLDRDYEGRVELPPGTRIGYVFQTPRLLPWRTALENVMLPLPPKLDSTQRALRLLEEMGVGATRDAYPGRLSIGEQRRVALARAFAIEPDLLLMDEPFVSLDEGTANQLRALLIDLLERRPTTVIFVTHDLREAFRLTDRLVFQAGTPARILLDMANPLGKAERNDDAAIELVRARYRSYEPLWEKPWN